MLGVRHVLHAGPSFPPAPAYPAPEAFFLEHVPEKCVRFSDKNMLNIKEIEHF